MYHPAPMMPYPQIFSYHQYPPHMMRPPHNVMPQAFAKPAPQATSSTKGAPIKVEAKDGDSSARANKTLDQTISLPSYAVCFTPTVSTETSVSGSLSDTKPVLVKKKTETTTNSQVSLQGSTSDESEPDTAVSKQPSKNWGNDLAANNGHVRNEKQHITVNQQEVSPPLTSQKKLENLPSSPPSEKEDIVQRTQKEMEAHPQEDDSTTTTSSIYAIDEKEEKSEVQLDDIDEFNATQRADTNRQVLEGVESLLLLSRVAESRRPSENDSDMVSIPKQPSGQSKPLKKRKLQLPMRADRKEEGPLPKRMPASPQRTPAFFHFLLHNRESIEQAIFSDGDTSYGLERSEQVAKEGAMWWLASTEDEKQRWAEVSTQKYLGHLS